MICKYYFGGHISLLLIVFPNERKTAKKLSNYGKIYHKQEFDQINVKCLVIH